jgi:type I restriction enzyme M protein
MKNCKNKFCNISNLSNESDVEQFFIIKLLHDLGYSDDYIQTKTTIKEEIVGKGSKKRKILPDYITYLDRSHEKPILIIDAKHPNEQAEEGVYDCQQYSSVLRRKLKKPKPEQYCIGINGKTSLVKHYDDDAEIFRLDFIDFQDNNERYKQFRDFLSRDRLLKSFTDSAFSSPEIPFKFTKVTVEELNGIFNACHRIIWKKEKIAPTDAFYEFTKIMFIKLNEDRRIHELRSSGRQLKKSDFVFSVEWLTNQENTIDNAFHRILFENVRDDLEQKIIDRKKKRIFPKNEILRLKPTTIKEVVSLLEHLDLHGVDEDLNGRMFETFLNATVRGKQLGQYFTPRTVVKFASEIADIKVTSKKQEIEKVADFCCGSAGFLIQAMTDMQKKLDLLPISNIDKNQLKEYIQTECLFGVDVNEIVTRIARMNMYLHSDGGTRIYRLSDALEKNISAEKGIDKELEREITEFRKMIEGGLKFDVVLTNPPFSMDYSLDEPDEWKILSEYDLAYQDEERKKPFQSVRSNVLFIERYHDLLKVGGRLITILDDGALCTKAGLRFRGFVKKHFVIEALISLPKNAFVNAEVHPNTSILFLRKKLDPTEIENSIFIARCDNIGQNDAGKPTPEKNELPMILSAYQNYKSSTIKIPPEKFLVLQENPLCFAINPSLLDVEKRFDVYYYPDYFKMMKELEGSRYNLIPLSELIKLPIKQGYAFKSRNFLPSGSIGIVRIRNIGKEGNIKYEKMVYAPQVMFEENPDFVARQNDIIMAMDGDEFRAAMVPANFNGMINQRIAIIKTKPGIQPEIIREYITGRFGRIQLERKKTKTTAGHITSDDIKNIKIPDFRKSQDDIIKIFHSELNHAEKMSRMAKKMVNNARNKIQEKILGL